MSRDVYDVTVGVYLRDGVDEDGESLRRPCAQEYRRVRVVAESAIDARLVACQVAACTSLMPVSAELTGVTSDESGERR